MQSIPKHLAGAYAHCQGVARRHYENFPVASVLVPAGLRPHVAAVYAFARRADDFADEAHFSGCRTARLDAWERQLENALAGRARHPVFRALSHTVAQFSLDPAPLFDLLSAFRQDVRVTRYRAFSELLDYCRRSANPVGRIVLALFGQDSARNVAWSDAICTALQLANFWQDVAVDRDKDRIYLPTEDMARFGVSESDVLEGRVTDGFRELMGFEVARTRNLFNVGRPLCQKVPGRLGYELKAVWLGGMGILDGVEAAGYDVFRARPAHGTRERLRFLADTLFPGAFSRAAERYANG
ncbi:MAG: squalene synthase HpnC [Leptospirillia bacterium]